MNNLKNLASKPKFLSPLSCLVIGVTFITLFFDTKSFDPINTPKLAALVMIASISVYPIVKYWQLDFSRNNIDLLFVALLILFLLSGAISVYFSDTLLVALTGETQRRNGFLAYFALAILAFAVSRVVNFNDLTNLFRLSILTGATFSLYGLIQISGNDPVSWVNPYNAVIATVGNPNFASALMAIFATLSFTVFFVSNYSYAFKALAIACFLMCSTAIVFSDSRQGLVSLSLALAFFVSFYLYLVKKKLGFVVIYLSVLFSVLAVLGMLQKGPMATLIYKPSVSIRGFYWDAAVEMIKAFPFTGVGFDHYGYYFKEYRSVDYPLRVGFDLTSTNAHNTFLQMFSTGGLPLGLSYAILVITTFVIGVKLVRNSSSIHRILSLGLLSGWLAFQAQSVISIDNIGISIWGWLLTGAIFGLASKKEINSKLSVSPAQISPKKSQLSLKPFLASGIFVIPAIIFSILLMRVESNLFIAKSASDTFISLADRNSQQSQQLLGLIDKHTKYVLQNILSDPNYKLQAAYIKFNSGAQGEAVEILRELALSNPRNLYVLEAIALVSRELNDSNTEIQARKSITRFDPWNAKNYLRLMVLYKAVGDTVQSKAMLDKILSFASSTPEAKSALEEFSK